MLEKWQKWAQHLKAETIALYLAYRHPRTPFYAKILVAILLAYAFSPIDLIPDFIPILGYLDDLLLLPLGIALALYFIPEDVMDECRKQSQELTQRPINYWMVAIILALWTIAIVVFVRFLYLWFIPETP